MVKIEKLLICCAPKIGSSKLDYEDAFTSLDLVNQQDKLIKIAIADGATESTFSREWANLLVYNYVKNNLDITDIKAIEVAGIDWLSKIDNDKLTWFANEKLASGSHASLLGISLDMENQLIKAEAIGDCCLFIIRNNSLIKAFPLINSSDFNNNPILLSTNRKDNEGIDKYYKKMSEKIQSGDIIILATDALSAWFMSQTENGKQPWSFFVELLNGRDGEKKVLFKNWLKLKKNLSKIQKTFSVDLFSDLFSIKNNIDYNLFINWIFASWLDNLRARGDIKNDDVTLYLVKIE